MEIRHKDHTNESFPVGMLVEKKFKNQIMEFYKFARTCDDIADNPELSTKEKLKLLDEQKTDNIYLLELKKAFSQDAQGFVYQNWQDLINYCNLSAAPVGRFLLHLHNEKANADTLCAILQITNHLLDIKYDATILNRIYIPKNLLQKHNANKEALSQNKTSPELKKVIDEIISNLRIMLKNCAQLPSEITSTRLRMEVYIIISLTNSMLKKIEKGDVLAENIKPNRFDWIKAIFSGTLKGLF